MHISCSGVVNAVALLTFTFHSFLSSVLSLFFSGKGFDCYVLANTCLRRSCSLILAGHSLVRSLGLEQQKVQPCLNLFRVMHKGLSILFTPSPALTLPPAVPVIEIVMQALGPSQQRLQTQ